MPLSKKDIDLSNFLFRGKPSEQFPSKNHNFYYYGMGNSTEVYIFVQYYIK